jgi:hypothetical protein
MLKSPACRACEMMTVAAAPAHCCSIVVLQARLQEAAAACSCRLRKFEHRQQPGVGVVYLVAELVLWSGWSVTINPLMHFRWFSRSDHGWPTVQRSQPLLSLARFLHLPPAVAHLMAVVFWKCGRNHGGLGRSSPVDLAQEPTVNVYRPAVQTG